MPTLTSGLLVLVQRTEILPFIWSATMRPLDKNSAVPVIVMMLALVATFASIFLALALHH